MLYPTRVRHALAAILVGMTLGAPATALAHGDDKDVFRPKAHPYGQSYSEWAADWWTWALTQPTPTNPLLDTTGAHCAQGQHGPVWFLAGTTASGTPITRTCTIPHGRAVLFPIINAFSAAFLNDPAEERTVEYLRSTLTGVAGARDLQVSLDGHSVPAIERWYEESAVFRVVLPVDNILGVEEGTEVGQAPGLLLYPSVDAGFYVMLKPLKPGQHVLRFSGRRPRPGRPDFVVDVTYLITVPGH